MLPGPDSRLKPAACLLLVGALCLSTVLSQAQGIASGPSDTPSAEAASFDGGLTRDSLEEAGQPARATARPPRASRKLAQGRIRHAGQPARSSAPAARREARRNLLTSFIYHWNGWVVRTFHTTKGTVRLRQVGFAG